MLTWNIVEVLVHWMPIPMENVQAIFDTIEKYNLSLQQYVLGVNGFK